MKIPVVLAFFLGSFVYANSGFLPTSVKRSSQLDRSLEEKGTVQRNADRFRRGLPPLPPFRRGDRPLCNQSSPLLSDIKLKRGLDPPSNPACRFPVTLIVLSYHASPSGNIQVIRADGTTAGYISSEFDPQHAYTLTTSRSSALQANLPSMSPFGDRFNILATNGQDIKHPYVGAVGGGNDYHFGPGQRGPSSAYLAGTGACNSPIDSTSSISDIIHEASANSPPSSRAGTSMQSIGYNAPGESQIWSMDCETREINAQWTNTDSSQPPTTIFYDAVDQYLGLTSDLEAFTVGPQDGQAVTFNFVPL
ncbi:hypothetical protein B0H12DRAFT_1312274 [Mycena haematopus]|nr:hypothetical protein B0H12DRAFT_1312274 [Mycena haematopus]